MIDSAFVHESTFLSIFNAMKVVVASVFFFLSVTGYGMEEKLQIGVIGLTHTHVHWIFDSEKKNGDFVIAGIVEPNRELAQRYSDQHGFFMDHVFGTMEQLYEEKELDAVAAFGNIYDHLAIVEFFAPKGIHVMVEKPLAVNLDHAKKMQQLAAEHNIELLTNYETTWYPTNHKAYELVQSDERIGSIRKIVVRDGHRGPKKIGINQEFLNWLTDPKLNGGGAITDFGCYGANLITWLMNGKRPISVTAITQQLQKENNPEVDDEAIILLTYDDAVGVIQASWNWPIGRKDMEVYGLNGMMYVDNRNDIRIRKAVGYDGYEEEELRLDERIAPLNDPFSYFGAIINGEISQSPFGLSSIENNMIVMEILDAARKSAENGETVFLR